MKRYWVWFQGMSGWHQAHREFTNPFLAIQWAIGVGTNGYMEWMVAQETWDVHDDEQTLVGYTILAHEQCLRFDCKQRNLLNAVLYGL